MSRILNLSSIPLGQIYSWLPRELQAEQIVVFPDVSPGATPLPTGVAVKTRMPRWRCLAISDCGCGMRLVKSGMTLDQFSFDLWDAVGWKLKENKGGLGDLGGGNHFLVALISEKEPYVYFLIHTGSRKESELVDHLVDKPQEFDNEFERIMEWARQNRQAVQAALEQFFGPLELIVDRPHNSFEKLDDGSVIIRKGSVRVEPGELNVIPASLNDKAALVRAKSRVKNILNSLSHGTGRQMSRSETKEYASQYDFDQLRRRVYIPSYIQNDSLRTEGPYAYRLLENTLQYLHDYIEVVDLFEIIAYLGHL
ncbi:MAG: RtcB family protein [Candidatus Helarchaeota archaeon]